MTTVDTEVGSEVLSATGGSARSQLDELQERSWKPRPHVALLVAGASFVVPVASALVAVQIAARVFRRPEGVIALVAWLGGLIMLATATSWAVERLSRRLLPLAAMLRLSLVFPDHAPSRFAVTLRTGSGKALERALHRAETDAKFSTGEHAAALVVGLISSVSSHDRLTRGHCERVRAYADLIGEELGLDADSKNKLHWAALLHDVGKLDVPAEILNKTDKLTPDEWQIIRGHPAASVRWIEPLRPWLGDWVLAASEHHERYDGDGYPLRLRGEEISLAGRIVAVADAFDVMTAARSYKKAFPAAQARAELANNAGTQFDPRVVRAFLSISLGRLKLVMGPLAWLSGLSGMFSVGGVTSAATAALTTTAVAATSFMAPAAAVTTHHDARSLSATGSSSSFASGTTPGAGAANPGSARRPGTPHRARRGDAAGGGTTTGTVPVTPIGEPTGAGGTRHTPSRTASPTTIPSAGNGGTRPSPTPTTTGPIDPTPTTTPRTTPGGTPTTLPVFVTPTTSPGPIGHAPVANDDYTGSLLNSNVAIAVLANDTDVDGNLDPSTLKLVTLPSGGYQSISVANGTIHLRVGLLYTGTLVFSYEVCDTTNLCSHATVTAKFTLGL